MRKLLIFIPIIIGVLFYFLNTLPISAQTQEEYNSTTTREVETAQSTPSSSFTSPQALPLNTEPDVPHNLSTYTQSVFIEILGAGSCFMAGFNPLSVDGRCLGINPVTKQLGYAEPDGGLVAVVGEFIGSTYNIPISSTQYATYMAGNFGVSQTAYAQQGIGFLGLMPILKVWEIFRDMTYFLFLIVFIVLGLGIMFRLNLDARSVMTVQNQLPKIIIALVLITLSYAIVGFLVDVMYVVMYLIINIFASKGLATIPDIATNPINAVGGLGGINAVTEPVASTAGNALGGIFDGNLGGGLGNFLTKVIGGIVGGSAGAGIGKLVGAIGGLALGGVAAALAIPTGGASLLTIPAIIAIGSGAGAGIATGSTIGSLIGGTAGGIIGAAASGTIIKLLAFLIAYLVILIAVLSALFRTWIMLIKAFIMVLIGTIFAPFWILAGILPGVGGGVGSWLRMIISNLAAFPTVLILFLIGKAIQEQAFSSPDTLLIPPFVGELGDNPASGFASIIGLGVILIMPEALNIVKSALKAPDTGGLTGGLGRSLGVGQGVVGAGFGGIKKSLWYTNPHTGESGRLKAWAGEKTSEKLSKVPGVNKVKGFFTTKKSREADALAKARSDREKADLAAGGYYTSENNSQGGNNEGEDSDGGSGGATPPRRGPSGGRLAGLRKVFSPGSKPSNPTTGTSGGAGSPSSMPSGPTQEEIDNEVERIKNEEGLAGKLLEQKDIIDLRERAKENLTKKDDNSSTTA